jgi:hypothetical protein
MMISTKCCHIGCSRPRIGDTGQCDKHQVYTPRSKAKRKIGEREAPIKARIRAALIDAGCIVWVHDVDYRLGKTGLGRGTSDLICIVPPLGRFLGVEVKRPGYSPSDVRADQIAWLAAVRKFGGVSGIATNEAEALALVAEARQQSPFA